MNTDPTQAATNDAPSARPALDRGTELAEQRTTLAVERSFLAAERTLMAWLRTSFSMIGFGFTLVKFFEYMSQQRGGPVIGRFGRTWASDTLGLALITIGTLSLAVAVIQHKRRVDALREAGLPTQWNLALIVATLVAVLGVFAFATLVSGL